MTRITIALAAALILAGCTTDQPAPITVTERTVTERMTVKPRQTAPAPRTTSPTTTQRAQPITLEQLRYKLSNNRFEYETDEMVGYAQASCAFLEANPDMRARWTWPTIRKDLWDNYQIRPADSEVNAIYKFCA